MKWKAYMLFGVFVCVSQSAYANVETDVKPSRSQQLASMRSIRLDKLWQAALKRPLLREASDQLIRDKVFTTRQILDWSTISKAGFQLLTHATARKTNSHHNFCTLIATAHDLQISYDNYARDATVARKDRELIIYLQNSLVETPVKSVIISTKQNEADKSLRDSTVFRKEIVCITGEDAVSWLDGELTNL